MARSSGESGSSPGRFGAGGAGAGGEGGLEGGGEGLMDALPSSDCPSRCVSALEYRGIVRRRRGLLWRPPSASGAGRERGPVAGVTVRVGSVSYRVAASQP